MKENDLLEQKLRNQEDDFRLQNEALMKELSLVLIRMHLYRIICFVMEMLKFFIEKHSSVAKN